MRAPFRPALTATLVLVMFTGCAVAADNVATMKGLYEAFGKGDVAKILDGVTDDVTWQTYGDPKLCACFGKYAGKDGVVASLTASGQTWDFSEFAPMIFNADGEKVFVEGHYTAKARSTGKEMASQFVHVVTFKGGKVAEFQEFFDTSSAVAALAK